MKNDTKPAKASERRKATTPPKDDKTARFAKKAADQGEGNLEKARPKDSGRMGA